MIIILPSTLFTPPALPCIAGHTQPLLVWILLDDPSEEIGVWRGSGTLILCQPLQPQLGDLGAEKDLSGTQHLTASTELAAGLGSGMVPQCLCGNFSGKTGKGAWIGCGNLACGEELDVVPSCTGGGEGAPRVWHRQEEGEDERFKSRSRRRRRRFPCPGDADVVPGRWG